VVLTGAAPVDRSGLDHRAPLAIWHRHGVRRTDGGPLPQANLDASLLLPDGAKGRAFLVYDNFRVLMRWNRSTYFALAVGHLADALAERDV
jgi:membrane-bound lytic murein transglycosylase B